MATNYKEIDFEAHIESHLLNSGYHKRLTDEYDTSLCLIPDEVTQFIQTTQPQAFEKLEKQYGADTPARLRERIARESAKYGVLEVLRKGVIDRGTRFQLAYFKPASGMEPPSATATTRAATTTRLARRSTASSPRGLPELPLASACHIYADHIGPPAIRRTRNHCPQREEPALRV
jgi:hypothetical protein